MSVATLHDWVAPPVLRSRGYISALPGGWSRALIPEKECGSGMWRGSSVWSSNKWAEWQWICFCSKYYSVPALVSSPFYKSIYHFSLDLSTFSLSLWILSSEYMKTLIFYLKLSIWINHTSESIWAYHGILRCVLWPLIGCDCISTPLMIFFLNFFP